MIVWNRIPSMLTNNQNEVFPTGVIWKHWPAYECIFIDIRSGNFRCIIIFLSNVWISAQHASLTWLWPPLVYHAIFHLSFCLSSISLVFYLPLCSHSFNTHLLNIFHLQVIVRPLPTTRLSTSICPFLWFVLKRFIDDRLVTIALSTYRRTPFAILYYEFALKVSWH